MRPFLLKDTGRIYAEEWKQIAQVGKRIHDLADTLVTGGLKGNNTGPDLEYDKMLDSFSEPLPLETIEAVTEEFPVEMHAAHSMFIGTLVKAWNYLKAHFPVSVEKTVTGLTNLPPSDYALGLFEDILEIVDKPLSVYQMIAIGRLTSAQAIALQGIYPALYKEIVSAIIFRIVDEKVENADYDCEFERGLSVLLAVPGIDPALTAMLGTPGPTTTGQQQKPAPTNKREAETDAHRLATSTQKIEQQQANT
jgi:hypothetical protein